jgi:outer membrane protein insertion porin family
VRASRTVRFAPNGREAIVTFVIDEGRRYAIRNIVVQHADPDTELTVLAPEQAAALTGVVPGDVYSQREVRRGAQRVRDALWQMGYPDARVPQQAIEERRLPEQGRVDIILRVVEGERFRTGLVTVAGNELTKSKVVRRAAEDILPDYWIDATEIPETERRLRESRLFRLPAPPRDPGPEVTIQAEDPRYPGYRDVLIEVDETNTASLAFGAAVDSDAGVIASISLSQRNFDLYDTPDSFGEFITGRAFRGAGQTFNLTLAPGDEVSTYSVAFTEPRLLESDYSLSFAGFIRNREFSSYDEERYGVRLGVGRRFGTQWSGRVSLRLESVELSDIEPNEPVDVFDVEDRSLLGSVEFQLVRTTADTRFRPTEGTRTELSVEQFGALGDYDFTKLSAEHTVFFTIDRDYLDRATVLTLTGRTGYIPQGGDAPIFERYNLGGRSFRGFDFRGIGPVGVRNDTGELGDDQVGGDFLLFAGAQVEKLIAGELVGLVGFVDSGTISNDVGLDEYRVSVGTGLRLYIPAFGQAPLAFDFAIPVVKEDTDEEEFFSFSIEVPF